MEDSRKVIISNIRGIPEIVPGDNVAEIIMRALEQSDCVLEDRDILVIAHKIISKAEGRIVHLDNVTPSDRARDIAGRVNKDPRKVEMILRESREVLRVRPPQQAGNEGLLICEHALGFISANAGVDDSNVPGRENIALWPRDPDASARQIRTLLEARAGARIGVIISDTFGRPWRRGLVNVAIGIAGIPPLIDLTGQPDADGHTLRATIPAFADEVAAAAGLVMEKSAGTPVVLFRGLDWREEDQTAKALIRMRKEDLFSLKKEGTANGHEEETVNQRE